MQIRVKYFGMAAENAGKDEETMEVAENVSLYQVKESVISSRNLNKIELKIAVNQSITNDNISLNKNDEVAFLPPFAGG